MRKLLLGLLTAAAIGVGSMAAAAPASAAIYVVHHVPFCAVHPYAYACHPHWHPRYWGPVWHGPVWGGWHHHWHHWH